MTKKLCDMCGEPATYALKLWESTVGLTSDIDLCDAHAAPVVTSVKQNVMTQASVSYMREMMAKNATAHA